MAKSYGGIRNVGVVNQSDYASNKAEFERLLATGKYDVEKSYLSPTGAYVLYEKGHEYHIEELEAARAMADHGIIVEMNKEGDPARATAIDAKGNYKFSEGTLSIEKLSYEQSTKTQPTNNAERSVKKALEHCRSKGSDVAVIYNRGGVFHRGDISRGIASYEKFSTNTHRFKAILVIDKHGSVYEWTHDK